MASGLFITFEGLDGSGKTTQLRLLAEWLRARGLLVTTLRQPGGTALGDRIRAVLLDARSEDALGPIAPMAELTLMFADRAQAIAQIIRPALASGAIVLCDRFSDSSEAYQGTGRGLGSGPVRALHTAVCAGVQPDLTLLLLPDVAASLARARLRNHRAPTEQEGRFERMDDNFFARVHAGYEAIAAREPGRVVPLRGNGSVDDFQQAIRAAVIERLPTLSRSTLSDPPAKTSGPLTDGVAR